MLQRDLPVTFDQVPLAQGWHTSEVFADIAAENVPTPHASQSSGRASTSDHFPAAHGVQWLSDVLAERLDHLPASQAVQLLSDVATR